MNEFGYYLGIFRRIWDIISFPLCVLILLLFVIKYKPEQKIYNVAPVVTINEDGSSVVLLSNNSAPAFKKAAIYTAEKIAKVVFGYSNNAEYASNAAQISKLFVHSSKTSRTFRDIVQNNIQKSKKEEATFSLDRTNTIAEVDPKDDHYMVILLKGFQTITTLAGTNTQKVNLYITFYFNENRGEDGEIFKVQDMSFQ